MMIELTRLDEIVLFVFRLPSVRAHLTVSIIVLAAHLLVLERASLDMSKGIKSTLNQIGPSIRQTVFRPIDPNKPFESQPPLYNNPIKINPKTYLSGWHVLEKQRRVAKERQRLNRLEDMRDRVKKLKAQGWSMKKE